MGALKVATPDTVTVAQVSIEVLPANSRRRYACISNSTANGLWINFGEAAVAGTGIYIAPNGGAYEIDDDNLWQGAVNGITAAGSNVIGTMELQ